MTMLKDMVRDIKVVTLNDFTLDTYTQLVGYEDFDDSDLELQEEE